MDTGVNVTRLLRGVCLFRPYLAFKSILKTSSLHNLWKMIQFWGEVDVSDQVSRLGIRCKKLSLKCQNGHLKATVLQSAFNGFGFINFKIFLLLHELKQSTRTNCGHEIQSEIIFNPSKHIIKFWCSVFLQSQVYQNFNEVRWWKIFYL